MNKYCGTKDVDYVIYIDTDSVYVKFDTLVNLIKPSDPISFLDKVCMQKIEPAIDAAYEELFNQMNAFKNVMKMKREAISSRTIWLEGKKRYILKVHNNEGVQYAEPKLKITGIEAVKSSTPKIVREKFKEAYEVMLSGTEEDLQKLVADFYESFSSLSPEAISFPRGVSDLDKWSDPVTLYKSGTPIQVRASLVYNNALKTYKVSGEEIMGGNKIRYCHLRKPNPVKENVIGFPSYLPKEFDLHQYVDYELMFDKTFKQPLSAVSGVIGWSLEKQFTLDSFFS